MRDEFKDEIVTSIQQGHFLNTVYEMPSGERYDYSEVIEELVSLHNEGVIDIVSEFQQLKNQNDKALPFFPIRHIFEKALPEINANVLQVMKCVLNLFYESGNDLAAGLIFNPYEAFCMSNASRPKEALALIESSIDKLVDMLAPTIIAGAKLDIKYYLHEATRLAVHENIEVRKRAVYSLGKIQYPKGRKFSNQALTSLETSLKHETDDYLLGNIIRSAFSLYKHDRSKESRVTKIIDTALIKGDVFAIHTASEVFGYECNQLPEPLLDIVLSHLLNVKSTNTGTLDNIDYGLQELLSREDSSKGSDFIEALLLSNSDTLSLNAFDGVIRELYKNNHNILDRLMTRWFLRGDRVLCNAIYEVLHHGHETNILLKIHTDEFNPNDYAHILFLARKAIGYLFLYPVTTTSIIVSLIQHTNDDDAKQELEYILFDPLLINYPGKVIKYLEEQTKNKKKAIRTAAEKSIASFEQYLDEVKSAGNIPELHPSQTHRDTYQRHFSRQVSESMKEAGKDSVLLSLVTKTVLLYGRKSIYYAYEAGDQSKRKETPLHSFGTEIEIPRLQDIDPFGLDHMLRIFRAEQMIDEAHY